MDPRQDLRHQLDTGPFARESLFYGFVLPEHELMVFIYTWVGADDRAGHMFVVAGDNDERLAWFAGDGEAAGGTDFDDWKAGGLHVRHTELLHTAELGFVGDDVRFDATFTGLHEAFPYSRNADGCPSAIADDRFEQSCRVTGSLVLPGHTITFDTTGHRDHSWGTRDWDAIQDWKWISGQSDDGTVFNVMAAHVRGETTHHGYVVRRGHLVPVTGTRVQADYDGRWWQSAGELTILDEAGDSTRVEMSRFALYRFEAGNRIVMHEAGCRGSIDGIPARIHWECGWDKSYVALQEQRAHSR
jgi:hypothetical protein